MLLLDHEGSSKARITVEAIQFGWLFYFLRG